MRVVVIALALALGAAAALGQRPNVLLVIADDVGVDRIGAYGEHPDPGHTPVIDDLAARGVLFRNCWSNPLCSTSRATMLTGRYSWRTGVGAAINPTDPGELSLAETTLPELLAPEYRTAALGKWHLCTQGAGSGPLHPLLSGFETHRGTMGSVGNYEQWTKYVDGVSQLSTTYNTTDTVDDALALIAGFTEPWFIWLAFNAPHDPFHAPPAALHSFELPPAVQDDVPLHFKAAMEALDTELGRLLASMDPDVLADTVIVFVGDNGTPNPAITAPFPPGHGKASVYEGGVNVPLIVAGPGVVPGVECGALVNTVDIFATICDVAGVDGSSGADAVSLVPYLSDPARPSLRSWAYAELFTPFGEWSNLDRARAVTDGRFKLVHEHEGSFAPTTLELYDLQADPFEQSDLLAGALDAEQLEAYDALSWRLHLLGPSWLEMGGGLPGSDVPLLRGVGSLVGGEPVTLSLRDAPPLVPAWFVGSALTLWAPFKGGTMIPDPTALALVLALPTNAQGSVIFGGTWPEGVPAGTAFYFQYWIPDAGGPVGFSASNGIAAVAP